MNRKRHVLLTCLLALFVSTGAPSARAQVYYLPGAEPYIPPKDTTLTIRVERLAPGIWAAKVNHVWTGWVEMKDGILVIDAGMADSVGVALADTIRARSPNRPFRYLVLTSAHLDHILGAKAFLSAGATLVTQAGVASEIDSTLAISGSQEKGIRVQSRKRLGSADRPIDVVWLGHNAASKGDLVVYLPKQRVLFAGDLVWNRSVPWLLDADFDLKGWHASLDSLSTKTFASDRLVPGHGTLEKPLLAIHFTRSYLRGADEKASTMAGWNTGLSEVRRVGYLGPYEGMEFYDEVNFLNIRRLYNEAKGIKTPGRGRVSAVRK